MAAALRIGRRVAHQTATAVSARINAAAPASMSLILTRVYPDGDRRLHRPPAPASSGRVRPGTTPVPLPGPLSTRPKRTTGLEPATFGLGSASSLALWSRKDVVMEPGWNLELQPTITRMRSCGHKSVCRHPVPSRRRDSSPRPPLYEGGLGREPGLSDGVPDQEIGCHSCV